MELKNVFKTMVLAACCLSSMTLASCHKDDDNDKPMRFSATTVNVATGSTATVTVSHATLPLSVKPTDDKIATAKADKNMITVTGVKEGKTTIMVTDKNKQTGNIAVNVMAPLTFDKPAVNVTAGKEEVVTIKSGKAPYTVMSKDMKIATATVKDSKVTIKGVKAGTTMVTVTDKDKTMGTIAVTVK